MVKIMAKYSELLLEIILQSKEHPTAEQIFIEAKKRNPKIVQATVYNNLKNLMRQIMEAGFAMDDVALFLDTHPENQDALRYYKAVCDMRDQSMAAYERRFGPLRYTDVTSMSWNWVTEKWPWEGGC